MRKQLYLCLLILLTLSLLDVSGEEGRHVGVITYGLDSFSEPLQAYDLQLERDLGKDIELVETQAAEFCTRQELETRLSFISVLAQQVNAIKDLVDRVVGIVLTPGIPVGDTEILKPVLEQAANKIPFVFASRKVLGLDLPYVGVNWFSVGVAIANSIPVNASTSFAVIGYFNDPNQQEFDFGIESNPNFRGSYPVTAGNGKNEASQAVKDHPDLSMIVVTDQSLVEGVVETVTYLKEEMNQDVRVLSLGAPADWQALFDQGVLHAIISWDHYESLLRASTLLTTHLQEGMEIKDSYIDILLYVPDQDPVRIKPPYVNDEALGLIWNG